MPWLKKKNSYMRLMFCVGFYPSAAVAREYEMGMESGGLWMHT
jgi:hypothetical protein